MAKKHQGVTTDIFNQGVIQDELLRDRFIEPPFSVLDTKQGGWQRRKKLWKAKGLKSEVGRTATTFNIKEWADDKTESKSTPIDISIFDPALCEVIYHWFCEKGDSILDPFAGGSVRGIVANYLGFKYTGIDIRQEQIDSNYIQGGEIIPSAVPNWMCGDSNEVLDSISESFDLVFSCPPYADLEVYSDLQGDISNMKYEDFLESYESIIEKSCRLLKTGGHAIFVVGEIRDKDGYYVGFVPDTIRAFEKAGMKFYNEGILLQAIATASIRAEGNMKYKKLVKVHQNILGFYKPTGNEKEDRQKKTSFITNDIW